MIVVTGSILGLRKAGVRNPFSKGVALAAGLSLLAVACLAQNYTQSLIPEANDGIGISNPVAYWIIGEDGWSQSLFRAAFRMSIYWTLALLLLYPFVAAAEARLRNNRTADGRG
ncbi:hypothetical protein [Paenibacillus methanolicus]|uniref:hypothetical protein n=1 Tax=Paenibacillus methanolicus TaxID=582686 RepID=UPI0016534024|nr:hypothetical protein [Paenibacillus methanolicus]